MDAHMVIATVTVIVIVVGVDSPLHCGHKFFKNHFSFSLYPLKGISKDEGEGMAFEHGPISV